ncbi:MAG: XisI protein [Caldilineaceae bacterium]
MVATDNYRHLIKNILSEYAKLKPAYGDIETKMVFDDEHGSYTLLEVGWDETQYVHGSIIHVDLIGDKIWIQYDGTEEGIANELVEAGVPKAQIVLGFRPQQLRPYTGFAVN